MDLETALKKNTPTIRPNICATQILIDTLDEKNKSVLLEAMKTYPDYLIIKALRSEGLKLSELSLKSHRLGECKCVTR